MLLHFAGKQIAQHVLQSCFFHDASSMGLYITCERLREVDTAALLSEALQHGACVCVGGSPCWHKQTLLSGKDLNPAAHATHWKQAAGAVKQLHCTLRCRLHATSTAWDSTFLTQESCVAHKQTATAQLGLGLFEHQADCAARQVLVPHPDLQQLRRLLSVHACVLLCAGKQVFVPLVEDQSSNMSMLHIGEPRNPAATWCMLCSSPTLSQLVVSCMYACDTCLVRVDFRMQLSACRIQCQCHQQTNNPQQHTWHTQPHNANVVHTRLPCTAADTLHDLHPAPPFGILEPSRTHPDGSPRMEGGPLLLPRMASSRG